jgi:hypothetical protein
MSFALTCFALAAVVLLVGAMERVLFRDWPRS